MKNIIYIFSFLIIVSSCTDVIELEVSSTSSKLVVDGWIDSDSFPKVHLYKSVPYFDNSGFPAVTGATVTLNDGTNTVNLAETAAGSGYYTNSTMKGIVGNTYILTILQDGKTYTAKSKMAKGIPAIDSVYFRPLPFGQKPGAPPRIITNFAYQENPEPGNCYMARFAKNDTMDLTNINFTNDQFINGNHIEDVFIGDEVKPGDKIRIETYGIPTDYFSYLNQIVSNQFRQQGLFSPPLAPYKGNISGDGLGFFRASEMISKDTIVP